VTTSVTICERRIVPEIVARDAELSAVRAFVERTDTACAALVLEGEAGIGKSTLWLAGVEHADARGISVLSARPAEAEQGLAHVGLGDLFDDALDNVVLELPRPRRRALERALLRDEGADEAIDHRALAVAVRDALRLLGERGRVLVAVDDVQWLDDPSTRALAFALRRLSGDANIVFLFARRIGKVMPSRVVDQAIDALRVERVHVGPLSIGAIQGLLQARLDRSFPRPTLIRLHETSGGNPFYALELARALEAEDAERDPTQPLHVPESLERLVRGRLGDLDVAGRVALSLVAAGGRTSPAMIGAAGLSADSIAPAIAAGVIEETNGIVRFTHPLLASAFYQELSLEDRERAHRLLAGVVDDQIASARHLALASLTPDADVALTVEGAATEAASRGASVAAAELAEHALRLTPASADEDRRQRAIQAARAHLLAGDGRSARAHADRLLARSARGRQRADALILMSDLEAARSLEHAIALRREALVEADDPALQAAIHHWLGWEVRSIEGFAAAEHHARSALELGEQLNDEALRARALATLGFLRFNDADPNALELVQRAYELADHVSARERLEVSFRLARVLLWSGSLDRARPLLEDLYRELCERDERRSAEALWYLSLVELAAGRLALAADYAERQREIKRQYAVDEDEDPLAIWVVARIAAHLGELDRARELADRSRALAHGMPLFLAGQEGVLGLVEAWSGKPDNAIARFAAADQLRYGTGVRDPSDFWWRAEYAEALLEVGQIGDAIELLDRWEADAARLGRERVLAQVRRCRGLVAAARGDVQEARALLEQAAAEHEAVGDPFGHARTLLSLGIVRRRARQKRAAREAIEASLNGFEAIGATGWAANARAELGHIGGRTREPGLTAAERRVATLVAEGRTNREVAAALFLGERTIETHLSHVYAKLGVRSRAELARVYRSRSGAAEQSSGGLTISS
jgi:DNA-binding CsgD family transcriptional regulator